MKNRLKISAILASMFIAFSTNAQSDSLGMPGDDLDLRAVLSIFKQSSSVEDFEKRLNSADTKVNNLDLNNDNQVDYLRVVDYGKDDFHSIVIQNPVSKSESQDVAVISVVKKGDNTAHIQIVGDETLYGKDYIIEPRDQAPLNSSNKRESRANDDVYQSANDDDNNNTQVMVNVWAWPAVTYMYSPAYSYWVSPWYWGYYPGWYSPWRPYGWYAYHHGFIGYDYGFYGYRRYHHAYPHVHNHYYGRRVSSGYVQKNAPNYGRRREASYNNGQRAGQPRSNGPRDQNTSRPRSNGGVNSGGRSGGHNERSNVGRTQNERSNMGTQRNTNSGRERSNQGSGSQRSGNQRSSGQPSNQRQSQGQGNQRVNSAPRNNSGSGSINQGGGGRSNSGGGGGRSNSGGSGGGGGRGNSGGGGNGGGGGRR